MNAIDLQVTFHILTVLNGDTLNNADKNFMNTALTKTATKTATKNSTKKVIPLTAVTMKKLFDGNVDKIIISTANQSYVGYCDFSVNFRKSGYIVYMSANNAKLCEKLFNTVDNTADTTKKQLRNKKAVFKFDEIEILKKAIETVTNSKKAVASK